MWIKAGMFLVIGMVSAGLLWAETPAVRTALLIILMVWAFCRAYYFCFYVVQSYVDPGFRYAGLASMLFYVLRRWKQRGNR